MRGGNNYTHRSGGPYGGKPSTPGGADSLLTSSSSYVGAGGYGSAGGYGGGYGSRRG